MEATHLDQTLVAKATLQVFSVKVGF